MTASYEGVAKLGFGAMRLPLADPDDVTAIDIEQLKAMMDEFIAKGGTYVDTAFVYHNGASETALREALVERYPRDAYTLATKCLAWACPTKEEAQACLPTSLERLGVDYIDYYLLHNLGGARTAKFDEYDTWNYVAKAKADGLVRHVGFSMHDGPETLEEILTAHPEVDFVQLQVNYLDWDDPVTQSARCMEVAAAHGVPVIIMEPVRGGRLANLPERGAEVLAAADPDASQASWAYRFCLDLPGVAHGARRRLHARSDAGQHGHLPKPRAADRGGARCHRRRHRGPAQRGSHPMHELRLLREGLPRGCEDPHRHEPVESGEDLRGQRVRQGSLLLAGRRGPRVQVHPVRHLRGYVPPVHRHHRPPRRSRRALRGVVFLHNHSHEPCQYGDARYCQHGGDEGALGHDPGVAAVLVAEHGAVGGHRHARQHHRH